MRKRWLPLLMSIIIFVTCFSGFTSYAASSYESDPAISIDVSYGVGEGIKYGRYLPLYMTINSRVKVQKVTMQMSIPRIDGEITLYEESFSLLPEVEEELAFYVPLMYGSDTIYLRMLDEDEKVIANKTLSLEVPKNYGEVFAGYINGEEEIIQYFDDLVLSGNNSLGLNIFSLTPDQIPEHWLGLDMLDIIFVAGTLTDFEEDIQKVITDWVENG